MAVFTFETHQSTPPFLFSRQLEPLSPPPSLKRARPEPEPNGPSRKKRRLRLALTTSPLSLPFATPRTSTLPDRSTSNRSKIGGIGVTGGALRLSPWRPTLPTASHYATHSSGTSSLLCKAAVLNRVHQRIDTACQRNPNLRWEKEHRQERELLLLEGLEMPRKAALKDGMILVNLTRHVVGNAAATPLDGGRCARPERRPTVATAAAVRLVDCDDCSRRIDRDASATESSPQLWCCKNGYPTPPASTSTSTIGLSNYDALDSEEEEKDEGGAAQSRKADGEGGCDANADADLPADEGIRDIFDFLTPPAEHQTYLSFYDYGDDDGGPSTSVDAKAKTNDERGEHDNDGDEERSQSAPAVVDTAPPKLHCSSWGCQSAFWVRQRRLVQSDAVLECLERP